jgi:glycerate 2-kinase
MGFLSAELKSGVEIVLEAVHFEEHIKDADLVITGEAKRLSVWQRQPKNNGIPVIALCGSFTEDSKIVHNHGIDALSTIVPGVVTLPEAMNHDALYMQHGSEYCGDDKNENGEGISVCFVS